MKHVVAALIVSTLSLAVGPTAEAQNAVSEASVQAIEAQIVMPGGAESLELYDRYYAFDELQGLEVVKGVFLLRRAFGAPRRGGVAAVAGVPNAFTMSGRQLPVIADGGCSVVTIYFDISTERLVSISLEGVDAEPELGVCNGRA